MKEENKETLDLSKIIDTPKWKAGVKFLDDCMVETEDERFFRFADFSAGWNACKKDQNTYTQEQMIAFGEAVKQKCSYQAITKYEYNPYIDDTDTVVDNQYYQLTLVNF